MTNQMGVIKTKPTGFPTYFLPQTTLGWLCPAALFFFTLLTWEPVPRPMKCCDVGQAVELLTLGYS